MGVLGSLPMYEEAREIWLGRGAENWPADWTGKFDIVTASGVFLKGHIPCSGMEDCVSALRPGGYFVTAMRSMYYEPGNPEGYREKLDELVASGKITLVNKETFMRGVEGEVGLFTPMQSTMVSFRKN